MKNSQTKNSNKEASPIQELKRLFMNYVGIDLGTVNTLMYVCGKGIIYNEPSLVAINNKTGKIIAIGNKAREMQGKTPRHVEVVEPLVDGVISDIEAAEEMMRNLLRIISNKSPKLIGPRVVVGVPSEITNVERRAVRTALKNAGARSVHIVTEPIAGAIGINLPFDKIKGQMIVDIGGGTSDIMVFSTGGIVATKNLRIAGKKLDHAITDYIRNIYSMMVGARSSEDLKKKSSPFILESSSSKFNIRGRNIVSGLPSEISVSNEDVKLAIQELVEEILVGIKEVLESISPEVSSDLYNNGLHLIGGGALLHGLSDIIEKELSIPVFVAPEPLLAVVRGTGIMAENIESYQDYIIPDDEQFNPKLQE